MKVRMFQLCICGLGLFMTQTLVAEPRDKSKKDIEFTYGWEEGKAYRYKIHRQDGKSSSSIVIEAIARTDDRTTLAIRKPELLADVVLFLKVQANGAAVPDSRRIGGDYTLPEPKDEDGERRFSMMGGMLRGYTDEHWAFPPPGCIGRIGVAVPEPEICG